MADIRLYLAHIGLSTEQSNPNIDLLNKVVAAHLAKFPYQNTELFLQGLLETQKRILPDFCIETIFKQFVTDNCPGYCFQNIELLAWALEELGFKLSRHLVKPLVQPRDKINEELFEKTEFSHETLIVKLTEDSWLIDTGFADYSLRKPLKLCEGEQELEGDKYNLVITDKKIRLETFANQVWLCLSDVDSTPRTAEEIKDATLNLFTTPQRFRIRDDYYKLATVTPTKRKLLCMSKDTHARFFKSYSGDNYKKEKTISTETELQELAERKFGLKIDEKICAALFPTSGYTL